MAEAIGLAASLIALIQLAGKITCLGYGYLGSVKKAPSDLRDLVNELNALSKVLDILQDYADKNPDSTALQRLNGIDGPLQGCELALKELQSKLEPRDGFRGFMDNLKWPLKEGEAAQFITRIERQKSLFTLALQTDHISISTETRQHAKNTDLAVQELLNEAVAQNLLRMVEKRKTVLNWLYSGNIEDKHTEITGRRQKQSGEWLLKTPEVQNWEGTQTKKILWGYGIPGAGKTFLCSVLVDHLQAQVSTANYAVAYIYFEYTEQDRQIPAAVLASLVKQIARRIPDLPTEIESLYDRLEQKLEAERPSIEDLYSILLAITKTFSHVFLIFDALDECDPKKQRKDLLTLFHRMNKDGFKIFITSRQYPEDIQDSLNEASKIELSAKEGDIASYILEKIDENPRTKRLVRQGRFQDKIISDLVDCANGMFLLVHFHIEYLCQQPTAKHIKKELENLKSFSTGDRPLDPIYDRAMDILRKQSSNCVDLALKILSWLVKARRTLTVDELREAVSIEPEQYELDDLDLPEGVTILDVCAGLVTIDENTGTIRLVHYTVHEYLLKKSVIPDDADLEIATSCTTYLSFDIFSKGACKSHDAYKARLESHPFLEYAACYLSFHLNAIDDSLSTDMVLKFLESPGSISSYLQALHYQWDITNSYQSYYPKGRLPLHVASSLGHREIVQTLLDKGDSVSLQDSNGCTPLYCAAEEGHEEVVRLLLQKNADFSIPNKLTGKTALHHAVWKGHEAVARLLLDIGADPMDLDKQKHTTLHLAAWYGRERIVELLIERGADISLMNENNHTVLQVAVIAGYEEITRLLLEKGADPTSIDKEGWTIMHLAVFSGKVAMVKLLLDKGVNFSTPNNEGRTPLHIAAVYGYIEMVQMLLDKGADSSIRDIGGMTAMFLLLSVPTINMDILRLLLDSGADTSIPANNGWTPLLISAALGREEAVKLLLEKGADISIADNHGITARTYAEFAGHKGIVKLIDAVGK